MENIIKYSAYINDAKSTLLDDLKRAVYMVFPIIYRWNWKGSISRIRQIFKMLSSCLICSSSKKKSKKPNHKNKYPSSRQEFKECWMKLRASWEFFSSLRIFRNAKNSFSSISISIEPWKTSSKKCLDESDICLLEYFSLRFVQGFTFLVSDRNQGSFIVQGVVNWFVKFWE